MTLKNFIENLIDWQRRQMPPSGGKCVECGINETRTYLAGKVAGMQEILDRINCNIINIK